MSVPFRFSSKVRSHFAGDFHFNAKQNEALNMLVGPQTNYMLVGGSRSSKTFTFCYAVMTRAVKAAMSSHAILRFRGNAAQASIAMDTLPKVNRLCYPEIKMVPKGRGNDAYFALESNESRIWVGGLDDKERVEKILGQEHCVDPDSVVLTADLRWIKTGELIVGQELVAFPEKLFGNQTLCRSVVERTKKIQAWKYRVVTDRGETVVSAQHQFVVGGANRYKHPNRQPLAWKQARNLQEGDRIKFAVTPWIEDNSREAGWLAGILDGEGCVSGTESYTHCAIAQNDGVTFDYIKEELNRLGVKYGVYKQKSGCNQVSCLGLWESMRLLGITRPFRLLPRAFKLWEGKRPFNKHGDSHMAIVLSVECLGRGTVIELGTSTQTFIADGFLGHNSTLFLNECSQITYGSVLVAKTRLAQKVRLPDGSLLPVRAYFDLNPTGITHWTSKLFLEHKDPVSGRPLADPEDYSYMYMNPTDNAENLPPGYLKSLDNLPERQRRRFYEGKYTTEVEGALFNAEQIERCRVEYGIDPIPDFLRVIVAVDPSGAKSNSDTGANEIGIIVAALGIDHHGYILADKSCKESPSIWGDRAVKALHEFKGDCIVAERNYGGEMVAYVIEQADKRVRVKLVTATRGKVVRAEPVSALYEKDKVHHVGRLPVLEDQLLGMSTSGYIGEGSPDRGDALVWALSELMLEGYAPLDSMPMENIDEENAYHHQDAPWNLFPSGDYQ